ncbi:hypothetical protein BH10BAC3_BH10BAC3_00320 [soil metagenome]
MKSKLIILFIWILQCPAGVNNLSANPVIDNAFVEYEFEMDSFPVPTGNPNQLFYLQRPPNTNTVIYELNIDGNGKLNAEEPVHVFWIRYPEGGVRKELSYIQRHFAYGVKAELMDDGRYKLIFAAYKKKNLYLMFAQRDNKYHVYTTLQNKVAILNRVFIQIDPGGNFWSPNIKYIEMKGKELSTGNEMIERIMIAK